MIVQKALRKNSDERYQMIKEMLADLRNLKGELEAKGHSPRPKRASAYRQQDQTSQAGGITQSGGWMLAAGALAYHLYFPLRRHHQLRNRSLFCPLLILARRAIRSIFAMVFREKFLPACRKSLTSK